MVVRANLLHRRVQAVNDFGAGVYSTGGKVEITEIGTIWGLVTTIGSIYA